MNKYHQQVPLSEERHLELLNEILELWIDRIYGWRKEMMKRHPDISFHTFKKLQTEAWEIYQETIIESGDYYKEMYARKIEEWMENLESTDQIEAAAKMIDRLIKLKGLTSDIIDIKLSGWEVKYDIEDDTKDNSDKTI